MSMNFRSGIEHSDTLSAITLVLGGTRSGKSRFAERLAGSSPHPIYLATAEALDDEMDERIRRHRERRDSHWETLEEPLELTQTLQSYCDEARVVLVDCLTLWLSNLVIHGRDLDVETQKLLQSLPTLRGPVVFVSSEVGLGGIAANEMARAYADRLGLLHQELALRAQRVYFVTAGIANLIKNENE